METVRKLDAPVEFGMEFTTTFLQRRHCFRFKRKIIVLLGRTFHEYEKLFSDAFGKSSVEPADLLSKAKRADGISRFSSKENFALPATK